MSQTGKPGDGFNTLGTYGIFTFDGFIKKSTMIQDADYP